MLLSTQGTILMEFRIHDSKKCNRRIVFGEAAASGPASIFAKSNVLSSFRGQLGPVSLQLGLDFFDFLEVRRRSLYTHAIILHRHPGRGGL